MRQLARTLVCGAYFSEKRGLFHRTGDSSPWRGNGSDAQRYLCALVSYAGPGKTDDVLHNNENLLDHV